VGATHPEALVAAVKAAHRADYGIALDGDADRLQVVDRERPPLQRRRIAVPDGGRPHRARRGRARRGGHLMTNMAVELALKRAA
jgi:phosphoglucosamine mutase